MEQDNKYYDSIYRDSKKYSGGYALSSYYPIWLQAVQWVKPGDRILDFGCGTGQFADMLMDIFGLRIKYLGVDFSGVAIRKARERVKGYSLVWCDVFEFIKNPIDDKFNIVIMLEFLEHINDDLKVIDAIPSGTDIIFSVPNYMSEGHVRCFKGTTQIIERYDDYINIKDIWHLVTEPGNKIFLARAVKR